MKKQAYLFGLMAFVAATPALAWTAGDLPSLASNFYAAMSSDYDVTQGSWQFSTDCQAVNCYGTNPDSPYGLPVFLVGQGGDRPAKARQLRSTDALVVILETPPPARYIGITPYIYKRDYPNGPPGSPGTDAVVTVFEALTDTVNVETIGTTGSPFLGQLPFTQLAAFVMTADKTTYADIVEQLSVTLGFPQYAMNLLPLPINAVPLNMGISPGADTYTIVQRTAYPDDPAALADYIARAPVDVFYLRPHSGRAVNAVSVQVPRQPGTGVPEPSSLATDRDSRVSALLQSYVTNYSISEKHFVPKQTKNYICVDLGLDCNGDNPDAIYTADMSDYVPSSRQDKILVVGVNHVRLNKATYLSHSIVNPTNESGIVAVGDQWLASNQDPASDIYSFTISYECGTDPTCLKIPEPTATDPSGLPFGSALNVTGRVYLEPATGTRPSIDELVFHRVFVLTKR